MNNLFKIPTPAAAQASVLKSDYGLENHGFSGTGLVYWNLPSEALVETMVAEGVKTTEAALALGARHGVELPITEQMAAVLDGRKTPRGALEDLMLRPQRNEPDGG